MVEDTKNTFISKNFGYLSNKEYYKRYAREWQSKNKERFKQTQRDWYKRNKARINLKQINKYDRIRPISSSTQKKIDNYKQMLFKKTALSDNTDAFIVINDAEKIRWVDNHKQKRREQLARNKRQKNPNTREYVPRPYNRVMLTDDEKVVFYDNYHLKMKIRQRKWYVETYVPRKVINESMNSNQKNQLNKKKCMKEIQEFRDWKLKKKEYFKKYYKTVTKPNIIKKKEEEISNLNRTYEKKTLTFD